MLKKKIQELMRLENIQGEKSFELIHESLATSILGGLKECPLLASCGLFQGACPSLTTCTTFHEVD